MSRRGRGPTADELRAAVRQADRFFEVVMPGMNVGASSLSAEQIALWNETEVTLRRLRLALDQQAKDAGS